MLFSNGKILIDPKGDPNLLDEAVQKIVENALERQGDEIVLDFSADPYPHYIIPDGMTFEKLKEYCFPEIDLQFRVIGDEITVSPSIRQREVKYIFTPEEKATIADHICELEAAKEDKEEEKKSIQKQMAKELEDIEIEISLNAAQYRQGYKMVEQDLKLAYDFNEKKRMYLHPETSQVMLIEDMVPEDFQLKFDYMKQPLVQEEGQSLPETEVPKEKTKRGSGSKSKSKSKSETPAEDLTDTGKEIQNAADQEDPFK